MSMVWWGHSASSLTQAPIDVSVGPGKAVQVTFQQTDLPPLPTAHFVISWHSIGIPVCHTNRRKTYSALWT